MKKCLFALLAVIAFAACKQVEPVVEPVLEVSATELSFAAVSDEKVIYVTANNAWSLEADVDWLSFNQDSGEASEDKQMVKVYADDNTVEEARTGKITVTSGKLTKVVNVTQEAAEPEPEPEPEVTETPEESEPEETEPEDTKPEETEPTDPDDGEEDEGNDDGDEGEEGGDELELDLAAVMTWWRKAGSLLVASSATNSTSLHRVQQSAMV